MRSKYARYEVHAVLACILCSRTSATIKDGVVYPRVGVDAPAVAARRCPHCGGRLFRQDDEMVLVLAPLPKSEITLPRRGRPPKAMARVAG